MDHRKKNHRFWRGRRLSIAGPCPFIHPSKGALLTGIPTNLFKGVRSCQVILARDEAIGDGIRSQDGWTGPHVDPESGSEYWNCQARVFIRFPMDCLCFPIVSLCVLVAFLRIRIYPYCLRVFSYRLSWFSSGVPMVLLRGPKG